MQLFIIQSIWQFLLIVILTSLFSLACLLVGLYIQAGRKGNGRSPHRLANGEAKVPDVMGQSHPIERQTQPIEAIECQPEESKKKPPTFAREIPSGELDQVFGTEQIDEINLREDPAPDEDDVDWQDEETELEVHRTTAYDENDFATGVSFDELQQVTRLIQKDELQPDEQNIVITAAVKLVHTDLWEKVTEALPHANEKIAKMLDASPKKNQETEDWRNFDIRNFI